MADEKSSRQMSDVIMADEKSSRQMSESEILRQLPDDFTKLKKYKNLTGPPSLEDYTPLPMEQRTSFGQSLVHNFKRNPLIPLGLCGVVYFLGNGLRQMYLNKPRESQRMMRGRVMSQSFVIVVMTVGMAVELWNKNKALGNGNPP